MTHFAADDPLFDVPQASAEDAGVALLRRAITEDFAGQFAVVSSFGADSAILLSLVAEIDRTVPVLFLDTGKHFPETLAYREALTNWLGLTDVRSVSADAEAVARRDPDGSLHRYVPDDCCALRKVAVLSRALAPFAAWASGRRRVQASTRTGLRFVETADGKAKINPLADWSDERVATEFARRGLPAHPLAARGYPSVGCAPCTRPVAPGEHRRAGRWAGRSKVECGIHARASGSALVSAASALA
jgi:phosphoadenosine phosphosulfate reductase